MNTRCVDAIARAVLYEGYMLYPYRPSSIKNRQRFNFGVLYPAAWSERQTGSDAWTLQTECLVEGSALSCVELYVGFLHLVSRATTGLMDLEGESVDSKDISNAGAIERRIELPMCNLDALTVQPLEQSFAIPEEKSTERKSDCEGNRLGDWARTQRSICGAIELSASQARAGVFRVRVRLRNTTSIDVSTHVERDEVLLRSLVSTHIVLGAVDGQFVSLLDPPDQFRQWAAECENVGVWPVLLGEPGQRDTMLASPIILYDHPQIAPESPGDLFDGTEIDEILALRILTLTDEEKLEVARADERARRILERTEQLSQEHFMKLHGRLRELPPSHEGTS